MKIAVLTFSRAGDELYKKHFFKLNYFLFSKSKSTSIKKADFFKIWNEFDGIIFISATGIAVRYIAPHIEKKDKDPAILVMDDQGKFIISLLSGHLGGANKWAKNLSELTQSIPVITTASDSRGFQSLDLFAKENMYVIEDLSRLTPVAGAMVNGESVAFYSEYKEEIDYSNLVRVENINKLGNFNFSIVITEKDNLPKNKNIAILRPKNIHLGIGAKKGADIKDLEFLIESTFKELHLSKLSIADIASIDIKKEEQALIELSNKLNVPFITYTAKELLPFEEFCQGSEFVKKMVGVSSVSCTSALKGARNILLDKSSYKGFTLSITKEV